VLRSAPASKRVRSSGTSNSVPNSTAAGAAATMKAAVCKAVAGGSGKHAVDRLYDPGEIEYREKGGDLQRGPAMNFFQIKTQRLSDQSADLTDPFHHVDHREEQQ
jgi:hypothetical protein